MDECVFCKLARGEVPAETLYEDDSIIAFRDINPAAKIHILIIPKNHIDGILGLNSEHAELAAHILLTAIKIAEQEKIDSTGFRLLVNSGADAGQVVGHLHFHLLGGEKLNKL